jgi:NAD(P)-dependent dehydrogenase (short-subunit alcohol dehydrogenase family)
VLRKQPLDLLVINAAVWNSGHQNTWDGFESTFQVNHFGHAYLVDLLLPLMKLSEDPRVVIVTSLAAYGGLPQGNAAGYQAQLRQDPPYWINSIPAMFNRYADSKLCNIMFAQTLHKQNPWLSVSLCHPGSSFTNLIGGMAYHFMVEFFMRFLFKSPTGAAQTPLFCCLSPRDELRSDCVYSEMSEMPLPWQVTASSCQALAEATEIEKKRMEKTASKSVGNPIEK